MTAVSNATPLIYLAKAAQLDLLRKTYKDIHICTDVWKEAIYPVFYARPVPKDIPIILQARSNGWLKLRDIETAEAVAIRDELLAQGLGTGESNSIALAKELNTLLLANDETAIMAAKRYNIETRWVTEILHDAMRANFIKSVEEYVDILDSCIGQGLYVSKEQREKAIKMAKEIRRPNREK